ncbi:E3 ubiquitin-protein ligase TRIM38-like isoform X1 [Sorex araneus]|nr:E3 ubiquitin-protein ligase TRIM38-like isoform X1 [Sorex araneus]
MQLRQNTTLRITHWKEKIKREKERINSEFSSLHTFLHQEEELYMCQLEKEREQKLSSLQDNVAHLDNKLQELENHIQELDKKCQDSAQNLLQDIKDTLGRYSAISVEAPKDVSLEVHTVCDISKLNFNVRRVLKRYQDNVTLDPDTAHPDLSLSDNQRTVAYKGSIPMYQNPGGFSVLSCILGRERFTSGRHYFEVDVQIGVEWGVGVCLENVPRGTDIVQEPQSGFWAIRLRKDKICLVLASPQITLPLRVQPQVVGIILDCDVGLVSFYNVTTGSYIYTFPKASFSHALRPYFEVYPFSSLSLISSNK